jgi:hypothetical protein
MELGALTDDPRCLWLTTANNGVWLLNGLVLALEAVLLLLLLRYEREAHNHGAQFHYFCDCELNAVRRSANVMTARQRREALEAANHYRATNRYRKPVSHYRYPNNKLTVVMSLLDTHS